MHIPFETFLALMILELHRQQGGGEPASWWRVLVAGVILVAASYLPSRGQSMLILRRQRSGAATPWLQRQLRRVTLMQRFLVVGLFAGFTTLINWPSTVEAHLGIFNRLLVDDILLLLPFLLALGASWIGAWPVDRALSGRTWRLHEYLLHHTRHSFYIAIPWLIWQALSDLGTFLPSAIRDFFVGNVVLWLLGALALVVFFPVIMKWVLGCRSMPPGEVRSRLESFCARSKLRCRDILVWKTGGARIFNAGVMGVVGRWRYILFTDALLANMSPVELEAVLAHELGHVRHRHVPKYVLFLLLFMMAGGVLVQLLPLSWTNNIWSMIGIMIVMGILILYTLFGFISRRFEHQADLESARLLGSPVPLVMALERLSILAGNPRTHYDWRHDSVAMRVRAVLRRGFDESIIARYGRRMRRLTAVLLVGGILLTTGGAWAAEQVLQHRHSRRVQTYEAGRQAEEAGRINEAISKYQQLAQAGYVVGDLQLARLYADADRPGVYDPERAMQHARKAMSVNEREDRWQIELHWTMAMVYLAQGDLVLAQQRKALAEQAIAEFDDAEPGQKEELLSDLEEDFREQREHVLGLPETPAAE